MTKGLRWSPEQLAEYEAKVGRPLKTAKTVTITAFQVKPEQAGKYRSTKVETDEGTFDSKKEYRRWLQLKAMQAAGLIRDLKRQRPWKLAPSVYLDGKKKPALRYYPDAEYVLVAEDRYVVEDTKSAATRKKESYRIKRHLMKSVHNIDIVER